MMQRVQFARLQINNESADHLLLRDVVIHSAVILTHKRREGILEPFIRLMSNPSTMRVSNLCILSPQISYTTWPAGRDSLIMPI